MNKIVIGLAGLTGVGKTTISNEIIWQSYNKGDIPNVQQFSFAQALKYEIGQLELQTTNWRQLYQEYGQLMRKYDRNYWIKRVVDTDRFQMADIVIIDDFRFTNEFAYFKNLRYINFKPIGLWERYAIIKERYYERKKDNLVFEKVIEDESEKIGQELIRCAQQGYREYSLFFQKVQMPIVQNKDKNQKIIAMEILRSCGTGE